MIRDRVAAVAAVVRESGEEAVLTAHNAGCVVATICATTHTGPVRAALLVTPPRIEGDPDDPADVPWVLPRERLPFRSVPAASRTDPYTTFAEFERYAGYWGSELVDAGAVGHLDTAAGFGPWLYGGRLINALAAG